MKRSIPAAAVLVLLALCAPARAGGGPETTLVVVNAESPLSRAVANEYVAMRHIPASHVIALSDVPGIGVVSLDFFKEKIWTPIEKAMKERGIEDDVDLIEYSADFPYAVDFRKVLGNPQPGHQIGGFASLTGVTYLARHVMAGDEFWNLTINRYFRLNPTAGRRGRGATRTEADHYQRAMAALGAKDYRTAADAFAAFLATYTEAPDPWYNYACCLARLGEKEKALDALATAVKKGFGNREHAKQDPDLESLRGEKRFQEILDSVTGTVIPFYPAHGFSSTWSWTGAEEPDPSGAEETSRYYLATELAYTGHDGNSLSEIEGYLKAAAESDGTKPDGTVYICRNSNVRSTAREQFFPSLVAGLEKLGHKVAVLEKGEDGQTGILPVKKEDVIGAVIGTAGFDWGKSGSRFLPGAIAEHLTSFGAHFGTHSQTKLTEFLRYGAAGSSGTVVEPLSIHQKFPNPMIHVFYAEGSDLAEAFYESIWGPYQLLVVGDGLARPFADLVPVQPGAPAGPWTGTVALKPTAEGARRFELFVDGRRMASGKTLSLDTTKLEDGWHDVRVVAIGPEPVETRSAAEIEAEVANGGEKPDAEYRGSPDVGFSSDIEIRARGAEKIQVFCQGRVVAEGRGASVSVPAAGVGPGPVTLRARITLAGGAVWNSKPIHVSVDRPRELAPTGTSDPTADGLLAQVEGKDSSTGYVLTNVGDRRGGVTMGSAVAEKTAKKVVLTGEIEAPVDGFYRLLVTGHGRIDMELDSHPVAKALEIDGAGWLPVSLKAGWHPISLEFAPAGQPDLEMLIGGAIVTAIPKVRHRVAPTISDKPESMETKDGATVVKWKKTIRGVGGVRLIPGKGAKSFPRDWVVEHRSGYGGWREVKDPHCFVAPGKDGPASVEIRFDEVRLRELRVRPRSGGAVEPARIEVLMAEAKHR